MKYRLSSKLLFILPGLIGLMLFYFVPFVWGFILSLTSNSAKGGFVGFENYANIIKNPIFLLGLKNSLIITAVSAPVCWVIGYIIATSLQRNVYSNNFVRSTLIIPYIMPSSAILLYFLILFDWGGMINAMLARIGIDRIMWLSGSTLRIPVILLYLWKNIGFCAIIFSAAMQSIPVALYEYADLEGIGIIKRETNITMPLIAPSAFLVFVFATINSFKIFREAYFIGGPYPDESIYTFQNYMNNVFQKLNFANVIAGAYMFAVIIIALFAIIYFIQKKFAEVLS